MIGILLVLMWVSDLVPLDDDQEHRWLTAAKLFVGFYTTFPKPVWVIEDGKAETRIRGNHFLGFGPGWLMTEPEKTRATPGPARNRTSEAILFIKHPRIYPGLLLILLQPIS